jgi:carboxymethylenebutenolidase
MDSKHLDSLLPPLKLDRRGFIATALASGFSLAAGMVQVPAAGVSMPAYRAAPAGNTAAWGSR